MGPSPTLQNPIVRLMGYMTLGCELYARQEVSGAYSVGLCLHLRLIPAAPGFPGGLDRCRPRRTPHPVDPAGDRGTATGPTMSYNLLPYPFQPSDIWRDLAGNKIRSAYPSSHCSTDLALLTLYLGGFNKWPNTLGREKRGEYGEPQEQSVTNGWLVSKWAFAKNVTRICVEMKGQDESGGAGNRMIKG